MKPSILNLDRLEFRKFSIEVNSKFDPSAEKQIFPQLEFGFKGVIFELGADLAYSAEEVDDPRHFSLVFQLSVKQSSQESTVLPYSVAAEACAFIHFHGAEPAPNRFKIVRGTGYMMLYGALREQIANFTGRSSHGLWFMPSPNFTEMVEAEAPADLEKWEKLKSSLNKKKGKITTATANVIAKPRVSRSSKNSVSAKTKK